MLARGDWIIPHYNGAPWFEKPILFYWLAAPCIAIFGEDIGPRLPSVLAALGLFAVMGRFVTRQLGPVVGRWTVIVLATSPVMAAVGRLMLVDALFTLVLSGSILLFFLSLERPRGRWLAGLLLGLAVLAKGPVAIVLLGGVGLGTAWILPHRRAAVFAWGPNLALLGCALAVVAVWYVPAYLQGGELFVQDFLIKQNVGRFTGGDLAHRVPWYLHLPYYFLVLGFGMLPWSWRTTLGWPRRSEAGEPGADFVRYCAIWAGVVVLFFTVSGSKLPHYVIPAFVPLAVLAGRTFETRFFGFFAMAWGVALAVGLGIGMGFYYDRSGQREAHELLRWVRSQGGDLATYQLSRRQSDRGTGRPDIQETSLPSLSFYLGRPLRHAETFRELSELPTPVWVFTRQGRIVSGDIARLASRGLQLEAVPTPVSNRHYLVFRLVRRAPGS